MAIKSEYARKDFSIIKKQFKEIGKGNVRLTQSSLILLQSISPTKSVYNFPVLENDNATGILPQEIRLNQNDEFTITQLGIYAVGTVQTGTVIPARTYKGLIYTTHANYNTDSGAATLLQPLWNGFLKIAVNNIVYVDKFDTIKSNQVQRVQLNTWNAAETNGSTLNSIAMESDGMNQLAPTIQLSGAKKNEITVILDQAATPGVFNWTNNEGTSLDLKIDYIGVVMRGLLGQNSASFQTGARK
jgi:hypothetical protein